MTYLDSSALVKLYVPEKESAAVARFVKNQGQPVVFTQLHELEIENGLRLRLFRNEASGQTVTACIELMKADTVSGVLVRPPLNWPDVFFRSCELSKQLTADSGCRSLDILHLACADLLGLRKLLTFDERQRVAATQLGLQLVKLRR